MLHRQARMKNLQTNENRRNTNMSTFDDLLKSAQAGETITDPRCGKHDDAVLSGVFLDGTLDNPFVTLIWSGLFDVDGQGFEHRDRLFLPREDSHPIGKSRFMQKLKSLEIVPISYKQVLYFAGDAVEGLVESIQSKQGESFPITITQDNRGFYNTTIRNKPRKIAS